MITPSKRRQAADLVKEGVSVSLAGDADTVKAVDNPNPYEVIMQGIGSDRIAIGYHGIAHTHLDSLAHINANGVFYNGYAPAQDAVMAAESDCDVLTAHVGRVLWTGRSCRVRKDPAYTLVEDALWLRMR